MPNSIVDVPSLSDCYSSNFTISGKKKLNAGMRKIGGTCDKSIELPLLLQ